MTNFKPRQLCGNFEPERGGGGGELLKRFKRDDFRKGEWVFNHTFSPNRSELFDDITLTKYCFSFSGQISGVIACGFSAVINRISSVFPVSLLLHLPTDLVQGYLQAISQLTQSFLEAAMRNEDVSLF